MPTHTAHSKEKSPSRLARDKSPSRNTTDGTSKHSARTTPSEPRRSKSPARTTDESSKQHEKNTSSEQKKSKAPLRSAAPKAPSRSPSRARRAGPTPVSSDNHRFEDFLDKLYEGAFPQDNPLQELVSAEVVGFQEAPLWTKKRGTCYVGKMTTATMRLENEHLPVCWFTGDSKLTWADKFLNDENEWVTLKKGDLKDQEHGPRPRMGQKPKKLAAGASPTRARFDKMSIK